MDTHDDVLPRARARIERRSAWLLLFAATLALTTIAIVGLMTGAVTEALALMGAVTAGLAAVGEVIRRFVTG